MKFDFRKAFHEAFHYSLKKSEFATGQRDNSSLQSESAVAINVKFIQLKEVHSGTPCRSVLLHRIKGSRKRGWRAAKPADAINLPCVMKSVSYWEGIGRSSKTE